MSIRDALEMPRKRRDLKWLKRALKSAIQLEFFTIPPYLTALWSIKDYRDPVAIAIREVVIEEMLHMSLVCNMLKSIGGRPKLADASVVPRYPAKMPGGVKPELTVCLSGLTRNALEAFMAIEEPEKDISHTERVGDMETFPRIGAFYDAIESAFHDVHPEISRDGQVQGYFGESQHPDGTYVPKSIGNLDEVSAAIKVIKDQGEGTKELVNDPVTGELAHYYRFKEVAVGRRLIRESDGRWVHSGEQLDMPECWAVARVPDGGYRQSQVPANVWDKMVRSDRLYSSTLRHLQSAWDNGSQAALHRALELMMDAMPTLAVEIMQVPMEGKDGNYAPNFRFAEEGAA
ncbi:MAG: ferritin-like protein [Planctomycetales bacterium]|nr:ferritin-like protein [Planctomycetales bacterium]